MRQTQTDSSRPAIIGSRPRDEEIAALIIAAALSEANDDLAGLRLLEELEHGDEAVLRAVLNSGVGVLCLESLERLPAAACRIPVALTRLRDLRISVAALYTLQRTALSDVAALFSSACIPFAVIKGAHIREVAYRDPAARVASDIDVLVLPADKEKAAHLMLGAGFSIHVEASNIDHEATFSRGPVDIDLHWDLLRVGRLRKPFVEPMLARRVAVDDFYALCDTDAVFLMLVHPAFAKYVNSPHASLSLVVDFQRFITSRSIDWRAVVAQLQGGGVMASGWMMSTWWARLLGPGKGSVPPSVLAALRPGPLRRRYLRLWLDKGLATRWIDKALLIQIGLTLFLHDRPSDAVRAIRARAHARRLKSDPLLSLAQARLEQA